MTSTVRWVVCEEGREQGIGGQWWGDNRICERTLEFNERPAGHACSEAIARVGRLDVGFERFMAHGVV